MISDAFMTLESAFDISGAATNLTVSDTIDLLGIPNPGSGTVMSVTFRTTEKPVAHALGAPYFTFMVVAANSSNLATAPVVLGQSAPWGFASHYGGLYSEVDDTFKVPIGQFLGKPGIGYGRRYLGILYYNPVLAVLGGNHYYDAGIFDIGVTLDNGVSDAGFVFANSAGA